MTTGINIPITATNKASGVIDQVRAKMNGLLGGVGAGSATMTKEMAGGAVKAGLSVMGLAGSFKEVYGKVMEASYEAKRFIVMGKRFGMPAEEIAKLSRYAEQAGLNVGTMGRGMMMLQRFAQDGIGGATGATKELIEKLGLSKETLNTVREGGMNAFIEIRKSMGDAMSEGEQMAVWQQLIGQRAFEMADFLKKTPEEMAEATSGAISMSGRVIDSLAAGQRAYADFQAEISKLFGELAHDFNWLFAGIGLVLRILMTGTRVLRLFGAYWKAIFNYAASFVQVITGNVVGGIKRATAATKELKDTFSEVAKDVARDNKVMAGYLGFGDDKPKAGDTATVKKTLRTMDEIAAFNAYLAEQKKNALELDLKAVTADEHRLEILQNHTRELQRQLFLIRQKGEELTQTVDYQNKLKKSSEQEMEIENLKMKLQKEKNDLYFDRVYAEIAYYKRGRDAGLKTVDGRVKSDAELQQQEDLYKAEQATRAYAQLLENPMSSPAAIARAQFEAEQAQRNAAMTAAINATPKKSASVVDSLQAIGGGGRISGQASSLKSISQASLNELQKQTQALKTLISAVNTLAGNRDNNTWKLYTMGPARTQAPAPPVPPEAPFHSDPSTVSMGNPLKAEPAPAPAAPSAEQRAIKARQERDSGKAAMMPQDNLEPENRTNVYNPAGSHRGRPAGF